MPGFDRLGFVSLGVATLALGLIEIAGYAQSPDDSIKLNQIQVIGTHNSYHAGIAPSESQLWQAKYADAFKGLD